MRIAIFGATSQIAKDLIKSICALENHELYLYTRRPEALDNFRLGRAHAPIRHIGDYSTFGRGVKPDALINFVGVGNPAVAALMGASIFDITVQFDQLALSYIRAHPECRYIFLSSGAAYGSQFTEPACRDKPATVPINNITPQDWYGAAKLHAECLHRAHQNLAIVDIRVFNYFSAGQDLSADFLICDILRSIKNRRTLRTSRNNIMRDYLHPTDFYRLIHAILNSDPANDVFDAYSLAPIDKLTLLREMQRNLNLSYELTEIKSELNPTGIKPKYYSKNTRASEIGYEPLFSSIDGVLSESAALLSLL